MRTLAGRATLRNLAALIGIQGSNALVPLIVAPIALSAVGPDAYAQVAITEALSALALAIVLFSFDVDGVARVAALGEPACREQLGNVLGRVLTARLLLFVIAAPVLVLAYCLADGARPDLLALWMLVPLGQVFHSYWFFQAIESNGAPAVTTMIGRLATIVLVLMFVEGPKDAAWVPLSIGVPFLASGLISLTYIVLVRGIRPQVPAPQLLLSDLRHGKEIFAGNIAVALYREMNVVILGIVGVSAAGVSAYALVEKAIKMLQACTRPLNQLFFPRVLRSLPSDRVPSPAAARIIARFTAPQIIVVLALIAALPGAYWAGALIFPQIGELGRLPDVTTMTLIMLPAMLFGIGNFMFGTAGLNALGARRYVFVAILTTGVVSVALAFALASFLGAVGAAISFLVAEALLFVMILSRYAKRAAIPGLSADRFRS